MKVHLITTLVRWGLSLAVLGVAAAHSHWSVALILALLTVYAELQASLTTRLSRQVLAIVRRTNQTSDDLDRLIHILHEGGR